MGRVSFMIAGVLLLTGCLAVVVQADADLTADFEVPVGVNATLLDGSFFTSELLRNVTVKTGNFATVTGINEAKFPALKGQGTSGALLEFPAGTINPPHTHPRSTELLYVLEGSLDVGFVDTNNKLFVKSLSAGDLFVFPKGLVHFQINQGSTSTKAFSGFSSSGPGTVRLPNALFKTNIYASTLAEGFGVSTSVIQNLIAATVE